MGKENINFLTAWIILGNVFATFSTDPEPTAISSSTTEFGKSGTSTPHSCILQEVMRTMHTHVRLIAERCFALTENNPCETRAHFSPPSACGAASHFMPYARAAAGASLLSAKPPLFWENFSIQSGRSSAQRDKNVNNRSVVVYLQNYKYNFKSPYFLSLLERKPRHVSILTGEKLIYFWPA